MAELFVQFVAIILVSVGLGLGARALKQPLILAYMISGVILGPALLGLVNPEGPIVVFSQIGVAFLLFLVGFSMSTRVFREVGRVALLTGIGQVAFTSLIGTAIAMALGFSWVEAVFIGIALSFSSTIVIVKLLSDKHDLDTLYGKISIGFLLIQDFIAIGVLVIITGLASGATPGVFVVETVLKLAALLVVPFLFSKFVLKHAFDRMAPNHELLFLSGIGWCFLMAFYSSLLGFSIEIGAFLAGISLASIPYNYEISIKIRPLRDFFLILFFVIMGANLLLNGVGDLIVPALIFSAFILIGNPIIIMVIMGVLGYTRRTSFLSGLTVAQISEFSLIMVFLGVSTGMLSQTIVSLTVLIGLITIAVSSYFILHGDWLFVKMAPYLKMFERKSLNKKDRLKKPKSVDIVLVGFHDTGHKLMQSFRKRGERTLVVDFNPDTVRMLKRRRIPILYGDVADPDIRDHLKRMKPRLIISTVPVFEDNLDLVRDFKDKAMLFVTARNAEDAMALYKKGADYVIIPYLLEAKTAVHLLKDFYKHDMQDLKNMRASQQKELQEWLRWKKLSSKRKYRH